MKLPDFLRTIETAKLALKSPLRPAVLMAISLVSEKVVERALLALTDHAELDEIDDLLCLLPDDITQHMLAGEWGKRFTNDTTAREAVTARIMEKRAFVRDSLRRIFGWSDKKGITGYDEHLFRSTRFREILNLEFPRSGSFVFEQGEDSVTMFAFQDGDYVVTRHEAPKDEQGNYRKTKYMPSFNVTRFTKLPGSNTRLARRETFTCPLEYTKLLYEMMTEGRSNTATWIARLEKEGYELEATPMTVDGVTNTFMGFALPEEETDEDEMIDLDEDGTTEYVGCMIDREHYIIGFMSKSDKDGTPPTLSNFLHVPITEDKRFAAEIREASVNILEQDFYDIHDALGVILDKPMPECVHGTYLVQEALRISHDIRKLAAKNADDLMPDLRKMAEANISISCQALRWHMDRPTSATPEHIEDLLAEAEIATAILAEVTDDKKVLSLYREELALMRTATQACPATPS